MKSHHNELKNEEIKHKEFINYEINISNELEKQAIKNNLKPLNSYKAKKQKLIFECKKCKSNFSNCCKNPSIPKNLKEQIIAYIMEELKDYGVNNSLKVGFLNKITNFVLKQIESSIVHKNIEFRKFIERYIYNISYFLLKIKLMSNTNQKIIIRKIARDTYNAKFTSFTQWYKITRQIIKFLNNTLGVKLRLMDQDPFLLSETTKNKIRYYKKLFRLSGGHKDKEIRITYLNTDYKSKILIRYFGKCQGIKDKCEFHIDYKFLPCLGYHHILENYKEIVKKKENKYILPKKLLSYNFNKALILMKTQIGGLKLICMNCHSIKHSLRYNFTPLLNFYRTISIDYIHKNIENVLNRVKQLANEFYSKNRARYKITKTNTLAKIKLDIKRAILGFLKKKYVIEYLFGSDYTCPICKNVNINDHLTCFEAHHTNLDLLRDLKKIEFGQKYSHKSVSWLIKNLIIQECIFICSNCHAMINSTNYRDNFLIILKDQADAKIVKDYYKILKLKIELKTNIILDWKRRLKNNEIIISNPFQLVFGMGEAIDEKIMCIYYINKIFPKDENINYFNANVFNFILGRSHTHFNNYKNLLIKNGYIENKKEKFRYNQKFFKITYKGKEKAEEIFLKKSNQFPVKFNRLINSWKIRYIEYQIINTKILYYFLDILYIGGIFSLCSADFIIFITFFTLLGSKSFKSI
ncbi:MAG: hypothetical protein JXA99_07835 [Candidatus Lokiarchaeota archaeon]|nr:hypothetical protein [Candidatus Lokiarchaeota archaeon]